MQANNQNQWLVNGGEVSIPLDQTLTVSGDMSEIVPFDPDVLAGIPINNLNYRVRIPAAVTQDDLDALIADLEAEPVMIALVDENDIAAVCPHSQPTCDLVCWAWDIL